MATLLLCAGTLIQPLSGYASPGDPEPTAAGHLTSAYDDLGEDDELDDGDDGSQSLNDHVHPIDVELLQPVSPAEEQTLLGDWGDSENED